MSRRISDVTHPLRGWWIVIFYTLNLKGPARSKIRSCFSTFGLNEGSLIIIIISILGCREVLCLSALSVFHLIVIRDLSTMAMSRPWKCSARRICITTSRCDSSWWDKVSSAVSCWDAIAQATVGWNDGLSLLRTLQTFLICIVLVIVEIIEKQIQVLWGLILEVICYPFVMLYIKFNDSIKNATHRSLKFHIVKLITEDVFRGDDSCSWIILSRC